jgi:HlyD family secretion protein
MATPEPRRSGPILLLIAGLAVAAIIFFAIRSLTRDVVGVHVVPVTQQTLVDTVSTNGKVEPVNEFQAHAPGPGIIKKIYVDVGQHVAAGQLLISMNDDDALARVASMKANLSATELLLNDLQHGGSFDELGRFNNDIAAARLEQQNAASNLGQLRALEQRGSASQAEVTAAQQRLDAANLTLNTAKARSVSRFSNGDIANVKARIADNKAAIEAAEAQVTALNIRTPISGSVYSIPFSQYEFVPSGVEDLLAVADLNHVRVRAYFDEPEIGRLVHGQAVKITWDAKPNMVWHGHIEVAPTTVVPYGTRSVGECVIAVDDAKGDLLPNTNVNIVVTRMQRIAVLSIPREALHTEGSSKFVYRIVAGKLARTPVTTGVVNLTSVEITSGLKQNDLIVLTSTSTGRELTDGLEVKQTQ